MAHNLLNELVIRLHFEKPRAECMAEIVDAKMGEKQRFSILFDCKFLFLRVVISTNAFNSSVQTMRVHEFSESVAENEICVALDCGTRL